MTSSLLNSSFALMSTLSPTPAPGYPPELYAISTTGNPVLTTIELSFNRAMAAGEGKIYVTDGTAQTVIDPVTGLQSMRIVGATDTHLVDLNTLLFSDTSWDHIVTMKVAGLVPNTTYNVFIAPGALQSDGEPFAGLPWYDGAFHFSSGTAPTDTTAPTLVSVTFTESVLKAGHDIIATITFSEQVQTPPAEAFANLHADLVDLYTTDNITWKAKLSVSELGLDMQATELRIDATKVHDLSGNAGTGSMAAAFTVDSMVGSAVDQTIILASDEGISATDSVTHGASQVLQGTINGHMAVGHHLELLINGVAVDPATLTVTETSATSYDWQYSGAVPDGENTITVRVAGGGHTSANATKTIKIDNDAPVITASPFGSGTFNKDHDVVITFNEKLFWRMGDGDMLTIKGPDDVEHYIAIDASDLSNGGKTLTIPAARLGLALGTEYRITLPHTLTDQAGNQVDVEGDLILHTDTAPDTTPPSASVPHVTNLPGAYSVGTVIEIRILLSEKVTLVGEGTPELQLNNEGVAVFDRFEDNGTQMVFQYTVAAGDDVGALSISDYSSLENSVADAAGLKLLLENIDFSSGLGNAESETIGSGIRIDTVAPGSPPIPGFSLTSDTGTVGDYITADKTPVITGSGSAGDTVDLYRDGGLIDSFILSGSGNWTYTATDDLEDGLYRYTVKHRDAAGNTSDESDDLAITIDTHADAPGVPVLDAGSDAGVVGDNITDVTKPTFTGSGAEAGALIHVYAKLGATTKDFGTVNADASGDWTLTVLDADALTTNGVYSVWATQTDVAGNLSAASGNLLLDFDTSAPVILDITPNIDVGQKYKFEFSDLINLATVTGVKVYDSGNHDITASTTIDWEIETEFGHSHSVIEIAGLVAGDYRMELSYSTILNVVGIPMAPIPYSYIIHVGTPV